MAQDPKKQLIESRFNSLKDRLRIHDNFFPLPALISFGLVIVIIFHLMGGVKSHRSNTINPIPFSATRWQGTGIWLGVSLEGDDVVITTGDNLKFFWPANSQKVEDMETLVQYLKKRKLDISYRITRSMQFTKADTTAVISLAQNLRYLHVRPVLYALGEAGISQYGFETKLLSR